MWSSTKLQNKIAASLMIIVLNFIAFWTLQLKLFPWPVTSPLLTVSSGRCGGWGALAYVFMLTGSFATN